jgi:hypothetical protein
MAIQSDPTYPSTGDNVTLSITSATGSTAATRFQITGLPENSGLETGMLVDEGGEPTQSFTPDVAGAYSVTAYDYRRFVGVPRYAGDPAGASFDRLVATQSGTVYVGESMDLPIRAMGHQITLRLTVVNGTVRAASLTDPTTEIARYAALDATVLAAVDALVDVAVSGIGESIPDDVAAFREKFNAHLESADAHPFPGDTVNPVVIADTGTMIGAIRGLVELGEHYVRHLVTPNEWHEDTFDVEHLPIAAPATDVAGAYVYLADLRRVYPAHINDSPGLHPELDAAANLTADSLLTDAIQAVLEYFADATPTAPSGTNPGSVSLAGAFGFKLAAA